MKIIRLKKTNRETVFLTFYFAVSPISKILEKIYIPRAITYMVMIFGCILYFLNRYRLNKIKLDVFIAALLFVPITFFGVLLHHADFNGANEMYAMIIIFFPAYFIFRAANIADLIPALRASAYIGLAIYLPNAFLEENIRNQYMTYAYDILFPLSVIVFYAVTEKRWYDIVISIAGTILLAVFGCRGAIVSLALFYIFIYFDKNTIKRTILISLILCLVILLFSNLSQILSWLSQFGISSYSLNRIAKGEALTSHARTALYQYIFSDLLPGNYLGYGPVGNRRMMPILNNHSYHYPHQLFLEILIDYGLVVGSIFSFVIIYAVVYLLFKSKNEYRYLTGLFCIVSFVPLMISGTVYAVGTVPYILAIYTKFHEEKNIRKRILPNQIS